MLHCPYCKYEMTNEDDMPEPTPGRVLVILCTKCGEPLMRDHGSFNLRKPTDEEFEGLNGSQDYRMGRQLWLEAERMRKLGVKTPAEAMWQKYCAEMELKFPSDKARDICSAVFKSGIAMALAYVREAGSDGEDVFMARMAIIDDELTSQAEEEYRGELESIEDALRRLFKLGAKQNG